MRLYLVQHGPAMSKDEDPDRPLTGEGRALVQAVAARLAEAASPDVRRIVHSGRTRARQTAELLAEALAAGGAVAVEHGDNLGPTNDTSIWEGRLAAQAADLGDGGLMLVGHLPFMDRMSGRLVSGNEERAAVRFQQGAVLCLERDDESRGGWSVRWFLTPDLVG